MELLQILEEVCEKNRWGRPTYHHLSTVGSNTAVADGSGDVQLFACKVSHLPNSLRAGYWKLNFL